MATILAKPPTAVIVRPNCPTCGTRTSLVRIFPDRPGYDKRTYECPRCERELTEIVRFQKAVNW
jgi:transposase-like protein